MFNSCKASFNWMFSFSKFWILFNNVEFTSSKFDVVCFKNAFKFVLLLMLFEILLLLLLLLFVKMFELFKMFVFDSSSDI